MPLLRPSPLALALTLLATPLIAQGQSPAHPDSTGRPFTVAPLIVTATRSPMALARVPQAVNLIDSAALRERPNGSPIEMMADLPGLDITGVGPNQERPVIRGERGQRILLLE